MDTESRRKALMDVIKDVYLRHKNDKFARQLVLLAFPISGASKLEMKAKSRDWCNPAFLQKIFNHYQIDIDVADNFNELEIHKAELGALMILKEYFHDVFTAVQSKFTESNFERIYTPFGILCLEGNQPPKPKPHGEKFISKVDALRYLEIDESEFDEYSFDRRYRHIETNVTYYDWDEVADLKRILDDENQGYTPKNEAEFMEILSSWF